MGSQRPKPRVYAPQSGLEPHFHVTDTEYEISSDGTVTICHYEKRRGELVLRLTMTMTATNLILACRGGSTIGADAYNIGEFQKMLIEDGGGNGH
jgi:hypothetical protein